MADKKISQLTAATTPLAGTEVLPIVQGGSTVKVAVSDLTAGRAINALSTTVTENMTLNGALASDKGIIKNIGQGYGVATDRWIGSDGTTSTWFYNVPTGGHHYFAIANSNKIDIAGDNITALLGNFVVGTSGKGIDFSATTSGSGTMTSELLADYEEGTWTPNFSGWTTPPTVYTCNYTKIGRTVFIDIQAKDGVCSNTGQAITGLPFTAGSSAPAVFRDVSGGGSTTIGAVSGSSTSITSITAMTFTGLFWCASATYQV